MNILKKIHQKLYSNGATHISTIALVVAVALFVSAPVVLGQYSVFSGYGYGYGTCTASRPNDLSVRYLKGDRRGTIALRWAEVSFDECGDGEGLDYYELQIRTLGGGLVKTYTNISTNRKRVKLSTLKRNRSYKFKVKAVATDGEATSWSLYKSFHTRPGRPSAIMVSAVTERSARLTWNNVARSRKLRQYRVVVRTLKGTKVFSKRVTSRLTKARTYVNVTGLSSATAYRASVRSVYSSSIRSKYKTQRFRTR